MSGTAPVVPRVFVSHHHSPAEDTFTARLVNDLRQAGAAVWVDVADIHDGDFMERINAALTSSNWMVLVLTPASLRSPAVHTEVHAAINLQWQHRMHGVIPIVAEAFDTADLPPTWALLQRYDAIKDYPGALAGLLRALGLAAPVSAQPTLPVAPSLPLLPSLGPAPVPAGATPALHLTPTALYTLGFRGYTRNGVEFILPPVCPVPSGVFTMGSDKTRDKEIRADETPQYPVQVGDFAIGQYPVTVAEYAYFVRAGQRAPSNWQKQLQRLDHPVVNVSWRDAVAYAAWLAKLSGQPWRLPTEAEWEKAARGTDGRIYPWGDAFDNARCNTREGGPGATTPVGSYPSGASPFGAQDMAGNVWEWTSSLFKPYPYTPSDGREDPNSIENRVLRGGSWYYDSGAARVAFRSYLIGPVGFYFDNGFRVVLGASAGS